MLIVISVIFGVLLMLSYSSSIGIYVSDGIVCSVWNVGLNSVLIWWFRFIVLLMMSVRLVFVVKLVVMCSVFVLM